MASPLSPLKSRTLNSHSSTPSTGRYRGQYEVQTYTEQSTGTSTSTSTSTPSADDGDLQLLEEDTPSSPFLSSVDESRLQRNKENMTPPKQRHSRIMSGNELSPLKILAANDAAPSPEKLASPARASRKSILSPDKRFPIRVSNPLSVSDAEEQPRRDSQDRASSGSAESPQSNVNSRPEPNGRAMSLEDALRDNQGLAKAIEIFEDEDSQAQGQGDEYGNGDRIADETLDYADESDDTQIHHEHHPHAHDETAGPDDTMISTFSNFSAVPNLTMLARLNQNNPAKLSSLGEMTPQARPDSLARGGRPSTFHPDSSGNNTTNLLMDFTDQMRFPGKSPSKQGGGGVPATPARNMPNLLDFDIPPQPTPRSVPTITPRELESLKSNFLSEISGLKATLSGKEAEVTALKTAVGDAEKRVGESLEQVREMTTERDQLATEKDGWEKRSREMEPILRSVREEIVHNQREREELEHKLAESEGRREAAETMAQEAESKLAAMRAGRASEEGARKNSAGSSSGNNSAKEVEMAVERVARELHALYKSKHETKVTALKKSYEGRWEKRVRELEGKIEELGDENERLRLGRDATMTRLGPQDHALEEERKAQAVRDSAQIKELGAEVEKLEAMMKTVRDDNSELRTLLEHERVEKGELVQLAEEMMSMQTFVAPDKQQQQQQQGDAAERTEMPPAAQEPPTPARPASAFASAPTPAPARTPAKARTPGPASRMQQPGENLRASTSRSSGLKAPGSSIVMPGRGAPAGGGGSNHERTRSGLGGGLPRPGSGFGARSGIMSSIERMGSHRGRGGDQAS